MEIHTSKEALTMSVCTRINTRPGKVSVEIRSKSDNYFMRIEYHLNILMYILSYHLSN